MDLEKVLFREIDNKSRIFCIRKEIVGVHTIIRRVIFVFVFAVQCF